MYYQMITLEQRISRLNDGFFWAGVFQDIKSLEIFETSIDPTMKNFVNWQPIVKNSNKGVIVSGIKLLQLPNKTIIDADSPVKIEIVCDRNIMLEHLEEWRADSNNMFAKLFE